jgi:hypothetical protein
VVKITSHGNTYKLRQLLLVGICAHPMAYALHRVSGAKRPTSSMFRNNHRYCAVEPPRRRLP